MDLRALYLMNRSTFLREFNVSNEKLLSDGYTNTNQFDVPFGWSTTHSLNCMNLYWAINIVHKFIANARLQTNDAERFSEDIWRNTILESMLCFCEI